MSEHVNEDDNVFVLLPLPADPFFTDAVDEAVAGDVEEMPAAQPERRVGVSSTDFASLYIRHRSSFALHARRFLHDQRDVDEVLQEAFLRLFLAMPELETELQALAYCRRTVTNLCIDRYRADQRRPRLVDLETVEYDPSDVDSYDDPVLRAEDAAIVREALALLSPLHREALIKREIEEKPLPQIAAELDIPEESVKHLLYRARRSLRRLLVGTSVEPGADLTATQALRLANERLARATLRSTNVLIALFVAAVTVVGALRVGLQDQQRRSGDDVGALVSGPELGLGSNPAATPRVTTPRPTGPPKSLRHPAPRATTAGLPTPSALARHVNVGSKPATNRDLFSSRPVVTPPAHAPSSGSGDAGHGSFKLTGDLTPLVAPQVADAQVLPSSDSSSLLFSRFVATTSQGEFEVKQVVTQQPGAAATVGLQVSLPIDGQSVTTATLGYTATVQPQADGTQAVTGTVNVIPTSPTSSSATAVAAPAVTSVSVAFTVDPKVGTVSGETVNVANAPNANSGAAVVGNLPMSAPTTSAGLPVPAGNVATAGTSVGEVMDNFAVAGRPAGQTGV